MIIYLLIVFMLTSLVFRYDINKRKAGYAWAYLLAFVIIVLVSGLRYKIGSDSLSYEKEHPYLPSLLQLSNYNFSDTRYNLFWILFCAFCKSISPSYYFMQFVHALVINTAFFYFISRNIKYRFTAVLLYFLFGFLYLNTEILRESLAISVFLFAIPSFYRRRWLKYYILAVLAFMFHSSALIVFLFPFFSGVKFNRAFIISLILVIISAGIVWQLFNDYIKILFVLATIESQVNSYLNNEVYVYNFKGILFGIINYTVFPLLAVVMYKRYIKKSAIEAPFVWLYIAIGIFVVYNNTIFTRFQNYLFFPFILFLANLFNELFQKKKAILFYAVKVSVLFWALIIGKYYNFFKPDITESTYIYQRYVPYYSVITKKTTEEREILDIYW